jgi:hypothetical protein
MKTILQKGKMDTWSKRNWTFDWKSKNINEGPGNVMEWTNVQRGICSG